MPTHISFTDGNNNANLFIKELYIGSDWNHVDRTNDPDKMVLYQAIGRVVPHSISKERLLWLTAREFWHLSFSLPCQMAMIQKMFQKNKLVRGQWTYSRSSKICGRGWRRCSRKSRRCCSMAVRLTATGWPAWSRKRTTDCSATAASAHSNITSDYTFRLERTKKCRNNVVK